MASPGEGRSADPRPLGLAGAPSCWNLLSSSADAPPERRQGEASTAGSRFRPLRVPLGIAFAQIRVLCAPERQRPRGRKPGHRRHAGSPALGKRESLLTTAVHHGRARTQRPGPGNEGRRTKVPDAAGIDKFCKRDKVLKRKVAKQTGGWGDAGGAGDGRRTLR